jgi:hypothetical protein
MEKILNGLNPIQENLGDDDLYNSNVSGYCQSCIHTQATCRFLHLDGREFFLCDYCFQLADHESDYGEDFETIEDDFDEKCKDSFEIGYDDRYNSDSDDEDDELIVIKLKSIVG